MIYNYFHSCGEALPLLPSAQLHHHAYDLLMSALGGINGRVIAGEHVVNEPSVVVLFIMRARNRRPTR